MRIKEITVRKARRITTKGVDGSYEMNEVDISETWGGDDGINEQELIDHVDQLVINNLGPKDPTDSFKGGGEK